MNLRRGGPVCPPVILYPGPVKNNGPLISKAMENYLAFISYRHTQPDERYSAVLRRALENFHLPSSCPLPKKRRVFRDTDELPTSTDLGEDIENALSGSGFLIAVCSEEYLLSKWCMREISLFIEMGKKDRILPVLVSGTKETAVPEVIRDLPIALDLRETSSRAAVEKTAVLLSLMSGANEHDILSAERKHKMAVRTAAFCAAACVILGLVFYADRTAKSISENNAVILQATEEAARKETEALEERDSAFLQTADLLTKKALIAVDEGDNLTAIGLLLNALPDGSDETLPVPDGAVNALRMALVMPERQVTTYHFSKSVETDFSVKDTSYYKDTEGILMTLIELYTYEGEPLPEDMSGYDMTDTEGLGELLILETDPMEDQIRFLSFAEGKVGTKDNYKRRKALEAGYTDVVYPGYGISCIMYGGGKQMFCEGYPENVLCRVDGEPFYAKKAWASAGNTDYAGWDGKTIAFFENDPTDTDPEAVSWASLEVPPVSAVFSPDKDQIAVLGKDGAVRLYYTNDGSMTGSLEEKYRYVAYLDDDYDLCTVSDKGVIELRNSVTLVLQKTYETPYPVRSVAYCSQRKTLLALCDGAVCVIHKDGTLMDRIPLEGDPITAAWEPAFDGNSFAVVYEDHADIYEIDTESFTAESTKNQTEDAVLLSVSLANKDFTGSCYNLFYSPDGRFIYVEDRSGNLSKWDGKSGRLCWINESSWGGSVARRVPCHLTRDGTGIWRQKFGETGIERIDTETGKTLYISNWDSQCDGNEVRESQDGRYALTMGMYYELPMNVFDSSTGEFLWSCESLGNAVFSEDGSEIYCLNAENEEGWSYYALYWYIVDMQIANSEEYKDSSPAKEAQKAADEGFDLVWRRIDSETGEILEEKRLLTLEKGSEGGIEVDEDSCMALADGKWLVDLATGEVRKTSDPLKEPEPLFFNGEEAYVSVKGGGLCLFRESDGVLIADAGQRSLAVSPSGESFTIYSNSFTPLVIYASDMETLKKEAVMRLEEEI